MKKNKKTTNTTRALERSKRRLGNRKINNIVELIKLLTTDYIGARGTGVTIAMPFGGVVTIGRFDNSGDNPLQLKVSSSEVWYPGSLSGKWACYTTWTKHLDSIDDMDNRDFHSISDRSINKFKDVTDLADIDTLFVNIMRLEELHAPNKEEKAKLTNLKKIAEKIKKEGFGRKKIAAHLIKCLEWHPTQKNIVSKGLSIDDIPKLLSDVVEEMRVNLELPKLTTEQARAADMLFAVSICEDFRTPGSAKYMRRCIKEIATKKDITFEKMFGDKLDNTICTLSPKGGTKITREYFLGKKVIPDDQRTCYEDLSSSSDDESGTKINKIKKGEGVVALPKKKGHYKYEGGKIYKYSSKPVKEEDVIFAESDFGKSSNVAKLMKKRLKETEAEASREK